MSAMKVEVLSENLQRALRTVAPAISRRSTLPITVNVLLTAEEGRLAVTATNLDLRIKAWVGARIHKEGAATISYPLLRNWMRWVGPCTIGIEQSAATPPRINISTKGAKLSGLTMDAADYPLDPFNSVCAQLAFPDPQAFRAAVLGVVDCAASDDSRPMLTGVLVTLGDRDAGPDVLQDVDLVAADGFRLVKQTVKARAQIPASAQRRWLIPAETLRAVAKVIDRRSSDPVVLQVNESGTYARILATARRSCARGFDCEVTTNVIQGTFPNYLQLFPEQWSTEIRADVGELQRAVRLASVCAAEGSGIIRLELNENGIHVSARNVDEQDVEIDVACRATGEPNRIAFNMRFLSEALKGRSGELIFRMTSPSAPGDFIFPDGLRLIVMPMFVVWGDER